MEGSKRSSALPTQTVIRDGNKAPNPMQAPAPQDLDPHLNPNYNFENFIKGNSNEFSRTVGETVAKNPAKTFNPLFLYGPSGVGKTHLTNAIGTRIKELYPEKEYCTYQHICFRCNTLTLFVPIISMISLVFIKP